MTTSLRLLLVALVVLGCEGSQVGRICDLGQTPGDDQAVAASPSLDCVSRTCLKVPLSNPSPPQGSRYPTGNLGLCTAECSSDDDCERVPESPCLTGFTCAVPVTVGAFCCRRFCVCKDYLVVPDYRELDAPAACDPGDLHNGCCNLEGRRGNPDYPGCP